MNSTPFTLKTDSERRTHATLAAAHLRKQAQALLEAATALEQSPLEFTSMMFLTNERRLSASIDHSVELAQTRGDDVSIQLLMPWFQSKDRNREVGIRMVRFRDGVTAPASDEFFLRTAA